MTIPIKTYRTLTGGQIIDELLKKAKEMAKEEAKKWLRKKLTEALGERQIFGMKAKPMCSAEQRKHADPGACEAAFAEITVIYNPRYVNSVSETPSPPVSPPIEESKGVSAGVLAKSSPT